MRWLHKAANCPWRSDPRSSKEASPREFCVLSACAYRKATICSQIPRETHTSPASPEERRTVLRGGAILFFRSLFPEVDHRAAASSCRAKAGESEHAPGHLKPVQTSRCNSIFSWNRSNRKLNLGSSVDRQVVLSSTMRSFSLVTFTESTAYASASFAYIFCKVSIIRAVGVCFFGGPLNLAKSLGRTCPFANYTGHSCRITRLLSNIYL